MSTYDLGLLVENCQRVSIKDYIQNTNKKLKEVLLRSELGVNNISVSLTTSKTGFGGTRFWFNCPLCDRRVGVLFVHSLTEAVGCRLCLGLEYRKRRYKGMVEGLNS